jgi:hypothetical protein
MRERDGSTVPSRGRDPRYGAQIARTERTLPRRRAAQNDAARERQFGALADRSM